MILGITATRKQLLMPQVEALVNLLCRGENSYFDLLAISQSRVQQLHHGDCVGGDQNVHTIVKAWGFNGVHIHPPKNPLYRAYCEADVLYPEKEYLPRNADIVDVADEMICLPSSMSVNQRGGTWWTIGYADDRGKTHTIIYPNGLVRRFVGR